MKNTALSFNNVLGRFYSQVSEKGRVALPSKFRQETGKTIIIARWYEGGLVIVGKKAGTVLERLARPEDVLTKPIRLTERFLFPPLMKLIWMNREDLFYRLICERKQKLA